MKIIDFKKEICVQNIAKKYFKYDEYTQFSLFQEFNDGKYEDQIVTWQFVFYDFGMFWSLSKTFYVKREKDMFMVREDGNNTWMPAENECVVCDLVFDHYREYSAEIYEEKVLECYK